MRAAAATIFCLLLLVVAGCLVPGGKSPVVPEAVDLRSSGDLAPRWRRTKDGWEILATNGLPVSNAYCPSIATQVHPAIPTLLILIVSVSGIVLYPPQAK